MVDPIRALLAEMADALDHNRQCLMDDRRLTHPLADRARATLAAAQPAPPLWGPPVEGAVVELSDQKLRELWASCPHIDEPEGGIMFARAVLAAAQPAPPAEGEVAELVAWLHSLDGGLGRRATYSRIAELLTRAYPPAPAPEPVPVSERLPQPEDCIPHPRTKVGNCCWGFGRLSPPPAGLPAAPPVGPRQWTLMYVETIELECSHWLPASALPLPTTEVPE